MKIPLSAENVNGQNHQKQLVSVPNEFLSVYRYASVSVALPSTPLARLGGKSKGGKEEEEGEKRRIKVERR